MVAVLLIALAAPVMGSLEYYGIEDTINDDLSVRNKIVLKFNKTIKHLDYQMNFDVSDLEAESSFDSAECEVEGNSLISCDFVGMTPEKNQLTLSFNTVGVIKKVGEKFMFSANYGFLPTDRTFVMIRLPQYSALSEENASKSFSPSDGNIISDGKHIMVFWERENLGEENMQFSVSYSFPTGIPSYIIISLTIIVVIAMIGVVVYARRKQHPVEVIASVLNKDEKVIVDILGQKDGKALQKVLVRESSFSKAKVSRLVKDMKDRGIVRIEPVSGRENRIMLSMGEEKKGPEKIEEKKEEEKS